MRGCRNFCQGGGGGGGGGGPRPIARKQLWKSFFSPQLIVQIYCNSGFFLSFFDYWHDRMRSLHQGVRILMNKKTETKQKSKKNLSAVF